MAAKFTPTEQRMMAILQDGEAHPLRELHRCLDDDLGGSVNVQVHVSNIRKKLLHRGQGILCVPNGDGATYRLVKFLPSVG